MVAETLSYTKVCHSYSPALLSPEAGFFMSTSQRYQTLLKRKVLWVIRNYPGLPVRHIARYADAADTTAMRYAQQLKTLCLVDCCLGGSNKTARLWFPIWVGKEAAEWD